MFPMEFDHQILDTLPLPDDEGVRRVIQILKAIVDRRVMPYFKRRRGTDPILAAKLMEHLSIERFEDEQGQVRIVSIFMQEGQGWRLQIHERVFDYLVFVIPSDPQSRLGAGTSEEQKMLALAEFLLRHNVEHMLYPGQKEREVIQADVDFAMDRRSADPTFYKMLRQALADEMNGIRGEQYRDLLDQAEQEGSHTATVTRMLNDCVKALADLPGPLLQAVFPVLDLELKTRILGECYRRSSDTAHSLELRASYILAVLRLFALLAGKDEGEALNVFNTFRERWGLVVLFRELQLAETNVEDKNPEELFDLFKSRVKALSEGGKPPGAAAPLTPAAKPQQPRVEAPKEKSLKDRIEEARNNPTFPPQVLQLIDKNKLNAVGHSGAKYSELIETLLAIPWGNIHKIQVSPEAFERGLNRTHYGLQRPKELVCDFFTNLIYRYRGYNEMETKSWQRTGSSFLFVGPPGVGKTSFAISIARNLGIPCHKFSLGGMRDEADMRGHGFTYEGSKPGAIVQGLIKMGVMNGMFILDEADKTEKFAIATLLEILDPEQNHLFHDKYTQTTVDIDLSNCHFILTANTLETVPPPVVNRCEVVLLDRYSVEEKVAIARQYLIGRIREKHHIAEKEIFFDAQQETDLLRYLIKNYTYEAGVRQLERIIRTLFLRVQRKEILVRGEECVRITRQKIKTYLEEPRRPRQIGEDDRIGETIALGVNVERGVGSIIPIQATPIRVTDGTGEGLRSPLSVVHATGNIEKIMDESRKVATTGIFSCAGDLGINPELMKDPIHLHFMGGSTPKDGPSAGGAIALALASLLSGRKIRRDVAMTGEIDTQGRITGVGALEVKLETACDAGCKTMIVPKENLGGEGGLERLPDALKEELHILTYEDWKKPHEPFDYARHILQVVAVERIGQAADVAFIKEEEIVGLESLFVSHAEQVVEALAKTPGDPGRLLLAMHLKDADELKGAYLDSSSWFRVGGCTLLVSAETREAIQAEFPALTEKVYIRNLDTRREKLAHVLQEILKSEPEQISARASVVLVAPFYLLKQDGILEESFAPSASFGGLTIFANNYTVQEVKIKKCRSLLNLICCHLGQLGKDVLESCPFLGLLDGAYVVDLSFIPEKYRLDIQRAEGILNRCMAQWLNQVEGLTKQTNPRVE